MENFIFCALLLCQNNFKKQAFKSVLDESYSEDLENPFKNNILK